MTCDSNPFININKLENCQPFFRKRYFWHCMKKVFFHYSHILLELCFGLAKRGLEDHPLLPDLRCLFPRSVRETFHFRWSCVGCSRAEHWGGWRNGFRMVGSLSGNVVNIPSRKNFTCFVSRKCSSAKDSTINLNEVHLNSLSVTFADMVSTSSVSTSSQTPSSEFYCLKDDEPGKTHYLSE